MPVVTSRQIYVGLLEDLQEALASKVAAGYVYISPFPKFVAHNSDFVQLVPDVDETLYPNSGTGRVESQFQVAVWVRVDLDQFAHSTARITDSTLGLLALAESCRQALIQTDAQIGTTPSATADVRWLSSSSIQEDADNPGWAAIIDRYVVGWEESWTDG